MSDNNDINLLDDDLEDDIEYDLGNEDEDRLLADDYELQDSELEGHDHGEILESDEKNFVETDEPAEDDILDLGVTDGLDDLDSEIQESGDVNQQKLAARSTFDTEIENVKVEAETTDPNHSIGSISAEKNNAENVSAETTTHVESEEEEESEMESRDRFKSERTNIVPLKSSKTFGNIPDSLDSVIPSDDVSVKRKWRGGKKGWNFSRQSGPNMRGGMNQRFHQQQQQHYQQKLQPFHSFQNSGPHFSQMQQPPQKILINPHFRGAVQPHPEARLIWDREGGVNNGFPQRMMGNEDYGQMPHGGFDGPYQQNPNTSGVHPDGLHPHHHHQNQNYPPSLHATQQQPPYYNENYMEQPPTHAPVPSGPEPWLNHSMMQQPPSHHQIPPPQAPPDSFFMPPPRDPLMFPPPQQQFPPFQEQGPRFPPPGNFMPPPDMHMQGAFRVPPPGQNVGPGGRFRQPAPRFQNMKRRVHYQGPPNGPKRIASPKQQNVVSSSQHSQQPETSTSQQQPAVKVVPVKRLDSTPRRKKQRMPDMSNLHEVKTVDTLPVQEESTATTTVANASTTNEELEQEDEETREYRRKIEEQKRLREKVLQAKEIRRMMAALEKQRLLKKQQQEPQQEQEQQHQTSSVTEKITGGVDPSNVEPPKGNAIATIVNRNPVQPSSTQVTTPTGIRKRIAVTRIGASPTAGIQRQLKHQQKQQHHFQQQHQQNLPQQQFLPQGGQQQKPQPIQKVSVVARQTVQGIPVLRKNVGGLATLKPAAGMQPGRIVRAPSQQISGTATVVTPKRVPVVGQQQLQARKVVLRGASSGSGVQLLTGQQQQRVVIQKSTALQGQPAVASPNRTVIVNQGEAVQQRTSKSVAVENLSVNTDEMKLRRMCLRVGTVENVQMQPQHQRAIITFANPSSAGMFIDRYQRKIVDLSLIQVSLVP